MPRHVHDDFSFLPTVDSTDEEDVMKDARRSAPPPVRAADPPPAAHAEPPAWIEPSADLPEPQQVSVSAPSDPQHVHLSEPDAPVPVMPHVQNAPQMRHAEEPGPVMPRRAEPRTASTAAAHSEDEEPAFAPQAPAPLTNFLDDPQQPAPLAAGPGTDGKAPELPTLVAEAPDAEPADNQREIKDAKKRAIMMTLGVHAAVALIMLLMHVPMLDFSAPEIVASSAVEQLESESWKKISTEMPKTSPLAAAVSPMLSTGISDIAMPEIDFSAATSDLNVSSTFGSFGAGVTTGGAGGKISFLGNTATAKHVIFVVDVSGSMSAGVEGSSMSRFDLLKRELAKSVAQLAAGTGYQILFFSDFAWPHDVVDSNDMRALNNYDWKITPANPKVSIPRFSYLAANPSNISKSKKIIAEANNPGGTNWGSGLLMALKASPKPEVVFFMTDGLRSDENGWIDIVTRENSMGRRTIIHTTVLGTPDAAREMAELARRNGGKFTAVMGDGKILKEQDLLR